MPKIISKHKKSKNNNSQVYSPQKMHCLHLMNK